jgi:putative DNA primase/helicase
MSDLTKILNGPWSPPRERAPDPPAIQLRDAMIEAGLTPPDHIEMDGKIHRFNSGTKGSGGAGKRPGWYVAFDDGIPAGRFGCWREGLDLAWRAEVGRPLSVADEMAYTRRQSEARAARDAERELSKNTAQDVVSRIWEDAGPASPDHPYLKAKGIKPNGARVTGDGRLVVPMYTGDGELSSIQYIDGQGGKLYHAQASTGGCWWLLGTIEDSGPVYVAEGFATAATIHEATGRPCAVAYSASNIVPVVGDVRARANNVVIVADNDASGVGQRYADQASAKHGARVVVPPHPGDANDYVQAGQDLMALLEPQHNDWLIPAAEFASKPAPISWIVKRWVQRNAMMMVHGPSGSGKTFIVLDWCLRIATGLSDWMGQVVKHGPVVYLAGEGHHGLRGRVAAWSEHNRCAPGEMWISRAGCSLNTPKGYQQAAEAIRALPKPPWLIVVDTLHRFLEGDENSAQDARSMLDACAGLMSEFSATVLLVHHTGNSDEAQHRARGSSAWRGALDIEVSVTPPKQDGPISIIQRKAKDSEEAEPVYAELLSVAIPGWLDEDGEQVTSAVIVQADAPPERKKDSPLERHRKLFEAAWWASGAEEKVGVPYLSRAALMRYLMESKDLKESSAKVYCKSSQPGKPISDLLLGEVILDFEHGWIVNDKVQASAMMMKKAEKGAGN